MESHRRQFLRRAAIGAAALAGAGGSRPARCATASSEAFHLKFAPHFGMFRNLAGKGLADQLRFAADQGFRAWEDNGMKGRSVATQERIARTMQELGIEMGVISALRGVWNSVNFAGEDRSEREKILEAVRASVDVAKRTNAKYMTVVPGLADPKLPLDYQTANCIELLKRCCDIVEPHGLVMVIEPLNRKTNHPGVFLYGSPQAYLICRAVNRPSCKILFDIYHQQVTEGNLMVNIDRCWDEIGYFQCGDNPGRKEPGTGEIDYANLFRFLRERGYRGIVGMEHGLSQRGAAGERELIAAYRRVDPK